MARAIGIDGEPLTARQVQIAVERLLSEQIVFQAERGAYEIEDEQLAQWLLATSGSAGHDDEDDDPSSAKLPT